MTKSKYAKIAGSVAYERFTVRSPAPWIFPFSTSFHRNKATLAYEEIAIPFKEEEKTANENNICRAIIMHGLMGSGRNWRNFARQLESKIMEESPVGSKGQVLIIIFYLTATYLADAFRPLLLVYSDCWFTG